MRKLGTNTSKKNVEDIIPLTSMQEGMLFHYLKSPGSEYYFEQLSLDISGEISSQIFARAWDHMVESNEMLRTLFHWEKVKNPVQVILKRHHHRIDYYDLLNMEARERAKQLEEIKLKDRQEGFDLREVPFRVTLCKLEAGQYEIIISHHHILYDGWSSGIILKEFFNAYNDLAKGKTLIKPDKTRYKEFINEIQAQEPGKQKEFWASYLRGFSSAAGLSIKRLKEETGRGVGRIHSKLSKDSEDKLTQFCRGFKVTPAALFYTAWGILLGKYNNCADVVFGTTVSGRSAPVKGIEDTVGLFINTLPLRVKSQGHEKNLELVRRMNEILPGREAYAHTPLVDIKACIELDNQAELFDSIAVIENYPLDQGVIQKNSVLKLNAYAMFEMTHYDLTLQISVFAGIEVDVLYQQDSFARGTIERMAGRFLSLLAALTDNPQQEVSEIEILSEEERQQILFEFNDTRADYPQDRTIQQLFIEQAARIPDHVAVIGPAHCSALNQVYLTYRQLGHDSAQLARVLLEKGVKNNAPVGIMVERAVEMIIGIFGILKAGGAYLPIAPEYPQERIRYILEDSGATILLIDDVKPRDRFKTYSYNELDTITIHDVACRGESMYSSETSIGARDVVPLPLPPAPAACLAYVIYTSGSTGTPKGVMVEQHSVINRLMWMQKRYPLTGADVILQKTPITFDVSVWELFWWALFGASLYLLAPGGEKDPALIAAAAEKGKVTVLHFVPSMLHHLLEYVEEFGIQPRLKGIRQVFVSGEAFRFHQLERFKKLLHWQNGTALTNLYGPTEATVDVSYFDCCPGEVEQVVPIGRAIDNIGLYILDYHSHLQPSDLPGELCISGVGLARGYLNNPALTAEKFIPAPAFTRHSQPEVLPGTERSETRLYRSGDMARWLVDGNIEFLGRIDHQVKVRGYRIEPGEIEAHLLKHQAIKEAVVMVSQDELGENHLSAFVLAPATEGAVPTSTELREFLARSLPDYMIPAYFKQLEQMPLTASGKVDRRALLPSGSRIAAGQEYAPPSSEPEKRMTDIWQRLLGTRKVGIDDNFFDLGGNSFTIIRLSSRLKQEFNRDIPVVTLFRYPTIRSLLKYMQVEGDEETEADDGAAGDPGNVGTEIAVIGMAGRFPGAKDIDEYWENLKNGVESIAFFTDQDVAELGGDTRLIHKPTYVKAKGILESCEYFDASFFGYIRNEAAVLDPQVRIFHECAWEALENAGYVPDTYEGRIGLYTGATGSFYWEALALVSGGKSQSFIEQWDIFQFSQKDYLATRISYKLDLKGPAISVQTACSTSLVAIDMACQGLLSSRCDMALAGGVSITLHDWTGYLYIDGMIFSPDGHCRAFDKRANGTVNGNGVGVVVLKSLARALEEGDTIHALIKGSAANNDGVRKVGFTAPSVTGQAEVIQAALRAAGVESESISYIEAHGTGTTLGDPIEMEGLKLAFASKRRGDCAIGSVKTNIGHLDAAAGVAGFIKAVLALKHRCIPASLNFETPNPKIDFENSPFYVNTRLREWQTNGQARRVGVNSFGFGGTNAHVILEEWPEQRKLTHTTDRACQLILLSARTPSALEKMTENLAAHIRKSPDINLADAAYTLQVGRKAFSHRRMLLCRQSAEAVEILSLKNPEKVQSFVFRKEERRLVFMFPGQGSQYVNMGLGLYRTEPFFREQMDRCFEILKSLLGYDLREILYPHTATHDGGDSAGSSQESPAGRGAPKEWGGLDLINQTEVSQPLIFVFEYALAKLLMGWGIKPYAMIGHSIGEYTAACLSGVFSLEDALKLVAWRGKLMQQMPGGSMLSVPLSEEKIQPFLDQAVSLAAVNTPGNCVVSGPHEAIAALEARLQEEEIQSRRLHTSHAFHSPMMEPVLEEFEKRVKEIELKEPTIPFLSNLTGNWISEREAASSRYWAMHLRRTVRFAAGLQVILDIPDSILLEVGPGNTLSTLARQHPRRSVSQLTLNLVPHAREDLHDDEFLLTGLGRLWLYGQEIDWPVYHTGAGEKRRRIPLPSYPFESQRYPVSQDQFEKVNNLFFPKLHSAKKPDISDWFYLPSWKRRPLCRLHDLERETRDQSPWLLFVHQDSLTRQLIERLHLAGRNIVTVGMGPQFSHHGSGEFAYTINPVQEQDYQVLLDDLQAKGRLPEKIIHLWNVSDDLGEPEIEAVERNLDLSFFSLLFLTQALGRQSGLGAVEIDVVTNNMQEVTGGDGLCPLKAVLSGPLRVIPLEYPRFTCRSIDVELADSGTLQEQVLVSRLVEEFAEESVDAVVAYRNGIRWVQTYEPVHLDEGFKASHRLRERGVYLITGGLGSIGLVLARHLAARVKARLALLSRSTLPGKECWEEWLSTHDQADPLHQKIRQVQEIEALGGEVMVVNADAANPVQMKTAIDQVRQRFGKIHGVIHAAGVADRGGVIQRRTRETTDPVLAAKVRGTLVLDRLLKDSEPDFFILYSSISVVLGTFGEAGYISANGFLDAYAQFRSPRSRVFTQSINWDTWQEVGMAVEAVRRLADHLDISLEEGILSAEGVEALDRLLGSNFPQVVVSTSDLHLRQQEIGHRQGDGVSMLEAFQPLKTGMLGQRPEMTTPYVPPTSEIEKKLVSIWQNFFGIDEIGIHDNFFELGGDSLRAAVISSRIHQELNVEISLKDFFALPTIKGLAAYIGEAEENLCDSIACVEKRHYYSVSPAQERMFMVYQLTVEGVGYNLPTVYKLEGSLDTGRLSAAFKALIQRHESLRTSFSTLAGVPVQRIHQEVDFEIEHFGSQQPEADVIENFIRPFDLSSAALFRAGLININDSTHILMLDMHHIISDGMSLGILIRDIVDLYSGKELPALPLQYKDYAGWQNSEKTRTEVAAQEVFWLEYLPAELPVLNLPTDFPRPPVQNFAGRQLLFELGAEETAALKELGRTEDATLYMVVLSIYILLLARLSDQEELLVGINTAGRKHADLQDIIGMFVNTLVLKNYLGAELTYRQFLGQLRERTLTAFENQDYPFEDLVKKTPLPRDTGRNPLFDTMFTFFNMEPLEVKIPGLTIKSYPYENRTTKFDLTLTAFEKDRKLLLTFEYCTALFKEETIKRFINYFKNIAAALGDDADIGIGEIEIISQEEKKQFLYDFNDGDAWYPLDKTVHQLFAEQVERTPDHIAAVGAGAGTRYPVTDERAAITYKGLSEASNHLAFYLRQKGVQPDVIVGILLERSLEMVIGILGILKAGGAYLPIDSEYPGERIEFMVSDSGADILLTSRDLYDKIEVKDRFKTCSYIELIDDCRGEPCSPAIDGGHPPPAPATCLAYIIYTSGTSGKPKGVMIDHRNLVRLMCNDKFQFDFNDHDVWTLFHSFCFDFSVWEMYGPLLYGGKLIIIPRPAARDTGRCLEILKEQGVTVLNQTPSAFYQLINLDLKAPNKELRIRYVIFGGEALQPLRLREWKLRYPAVKLINMYGITETTVHVTFKELMSSDIERKTSNIGRAIPTLGTYVLDKHSKLLPPGSAGELGVAGQGVGRGYLNRPELTQKKFTRNLYKPEERLYKSGDLVKWLPQGDLEYLGRIDSQVKIRGFRIELGEIESQLLKYDQIKEAVVVARGEDPGDRYLWAYIVGKAQKQAGSEAQIAGAELRQFLSQTLPDYMIPAYFIQLENIPLTANGKIDRKALPTPGMEPVDRYTPPRDAVEEQLVKIWSEVLGIDKGVLGIDANFFDLGGHSLKANLMVSRVHTEFDIKFPLVEVFRTPFIRELARVIKELKQEQHTSPKTRPGIEPAEAREYYVLSPAQKRLFILQEMEAENISYNIPYVLPLRGDADRKKLEKAFNTLISRHESLRTSFEMVNETPVQRVRLPQDIEFDIEYYNIDLKEDQAGGMIHETSVKIIENFIRPFDLSRQPLVRVGLIETGQEEHILVLDMHHIITDGTSQSILARELLALYQGEQLPPLKLHYKDFSEWQNNNPAQQELIRQQEIYWLRLLSDELPILNLPTDFPRPEVQSFAGSSVRFVLDEQESRNLTGLARHAHATLFMTMLALFDILLSRLSGQEEIIIGTPIAARQHPELEHIVGMFVNTLALRSFPCGDKNFSTFMGELKRDTLAAFENQEYPFEELVEKVAVARDTGRNPVFDVMFSLTNQGDRAQSTLRDAFARAVSDVYANIHQVARFDLILHAVEDPDGIHCAFEYCTRLFKRATIERFINYFKTILASISANPDQRLSQIDILPPGEKGEILDRFQGEAMVIDKNQPLHLLFEERAETTADKIAVVFDEKNFSYGELEGQANRLARQLRSRGTKPNSLVGIMIDRSFEMIVALLAVMKAGGAYLPIDTEYPPQRISYMLDDSGASLLLTKGSILDRFSMSTLTGLKTAVAGENDGVKPMVTPARAQIRDLSLLPFPDRTLVNYKKYHEKIGIAMAKHTVSIQASRGCPFNCAFCHRIWPKKQVARSAENIFEEMRYCYEGGVRRFVFIDDIFNLDVRNSTRLLQKIIDSGLEVQLFFPNGLRGDILTADFIDLMVAAGTVNIDLALESASPRVQRLIGKNLNLERFKENVQHITKNYPQIVLEMELMVGFPTETEAEALLTFDFLKDLHWVHFPNLNILKIYPNTDMYRIALENGISEESMLESASLAYHELPHTLPFPRDFVKNLQARFLDEYFLSRERLLQVLPHQARHFTEEEIIQKYDSYLPTQINHFPDILQLADISMEELPGPGFLPADYSSAPLFGENIKRYFPAGRKAADAFKILLIDTSLLFSSQSRNILYDMVEEPLGLMYLISYLEERFAERVIGKVIKSRIDFDSYEELHRIISDFKPDLIGLRTLTYYRDFFHAVVLRIRQWDFDMPIIAGGPYPTSDYRALLQDFNIDLVVLGEGELTLAELVERMMDNGNELPDQEVLTEIKGIAFVARKHKSSGSTVCRDIMLLDHLEGKDRKLENVNKVSDLAYVIYTSGSTGKPKGVMLEHRNLVNLLEWSFAYTNLDFSAVLQFSTISFDVSFYEIFSTLLSSGRLSLINHEQRADIPGLFKVIARDRIRTVCLPISLLKVIFSECHYAELFPACVRHIQTAGEQVIVSEGFADYLKEHHIYLHNQYGPAETHVVTAFTQDPAAKIPHLPPIGKPLTNTIVYILDQYRNLQPPGIPGELVIGGIQVGRGYLNQPGLTKEKFIPGTERSEARLYRTGDLVNWLPDGNIDFLGRIDHQVKVRGFRIEPGEVESQLLNHEAVKEAVVLVNEDSNRGKYLCAYIAVQGLNQEARSVTPAQPGHESMCSISNAELREYLARTLPDYMIPAYFIQLDKIPLTPNGKVDRNALPAPGIAMGEGHAAARDAVEEKLAEIWHEVLGMEKGLSSIDANFFEMGGHSLKATILAARIHKHFIVKVPLSVIFKGPTIKDLAAYIKESVPTQYKPIAPIEQREYYDTSYAQKRVWVSSRSREFSLAFNMGGTHLFREEVDIAALNQAFRLLIERHESLRTVFLVIDRDVRQQVLLPAEIDFAVECRDLRGVEGKKELVKDLTASAGDTPFDLERGPLLRAKLIRVEDSVYLFLFTIHHIVSDLISLKVLRRQILQLYQFFKHRQQPGDKSPLKSLRIQYKDYTYWQNDQLKGSRLERLRQYWMNRFHDGIPQVELPYDKARPQVRAYKGESIGMPIPQVTVEKLRALAEKTRTTLFMVLVASIKALLFHYSGQTDMVIGTPVACREHSDLENQIGFYLNTLPLRTTFTQEDSFSELLNSVKKVTLAAYEHQLYPFDKLVEDLGIKRESGRHPFFDVVLDMIEFKDPEAPASPSDNPLPPFEGDNSTGLNIYQTRGKFDLTIYFWERPKTMRVVFEYSTDLFERKTIIRMVKRYRKLLDSIMENPGAAISGLQLDGEIKVPTFPAFKREIVGSSSEQEG